jgi:hypothetical protein
MKSRERTQNLICERLKSLGYAREHSIRLYGEELKLTSNPIADGDGFAVEVVTRAAAVKRVRLPLSVVNVLEAEMAGEENLKAA